MRSVLLVFIAVYGCSHAGHTLAYRKAVAARQKATRVLAKAGEPYVRHAHAMDDLIAEIDEGYTQAQSHTDNRARKQWLVVKDEMKHFAADWEHIGALNDPYVDERTKIILGDLDAIINDEAAKNAD